MCCSEMDRVSEMENALKRKQDTAAYEAAKQQSLTEFEKKIQKQADKRKRRKENAKKRALEAEYATEIAQNEQDNNTTHVLPETPGGVYLVPNDGSFLETMLKLQQEKEQGNKKQKQTK